jgi:hypothetical protein
MANRIPRNPRTDTQQRRAFQRLKGGGFGDGVTIVADSKGAYAVQCAAPVKVTADGVGLDLAANGGLSVSAGKLGVNVDNSTLEAADNALRIRDGAITTVKLGDGQVTNAKIAGRAVDAGKLAVGAVLTDNIGDGQVTLPKCAFTLPVVPSFVDGEGPAGVIDGANKTFTLAHAPAGGSLHLYQNGLRLTSSTQYTLASSTITFAAPPPLGATLLADYRY